MSSEAYKIEITPREERGKTRLRQLRAEGFVPGIFYAPLEKKSITFKVDLKELLKALQSDALVYHISVGGNRRDVLVKAIQYHPVTDTIIHVDFQGVRMDETVDIHVPILTVGHPIGVKDEGGQLHHTMLEIELRCLVSEIPAHIEVDISDLHIGQAIHARDLDMGSAELVTNPDTPVVSVARARGVAEEEVAEEEELEEPLFEEEGEEPPVDKPAEDESEER